MKWIATLAIVLGSTALFAGPAAAKNGDNNRGGVEKVGVCHLGDDDWKRLDLPKVAADKRLERGAFQPGDRVPETQDQEFDEDCQPYTPLREQPPTRTATLEELCLALPATWMGISPPNGDYGACHVPDPSVDLDAVAASWLEACEAEGGTWVYVYAPVDIIACD